MLYAKDIQLIKRGVEQWHEKNVHGRPEAELNEKMIRNRSADRRQFKEYQESLGSGVPKTLDSFQKVKYTDGEGWESLNDRFKNRDFLQEQLPYWHNGEKLFVPAKSVIKHAAVIAGDGAKTELRAAEYLSQRFVVHPQERIKRVGQRQSDRYQFDVHWFERGGKQYGMKVKTRKDKEIVEDSYYAPPEPTNKPEKTMRLRYIGESFGVEGLTNGKVYEAWIEDDDYYRVIDDSGEDYLYSRLSPGPLDDSFPDGKWEIVDDGKQRH